jgi:hypothetical protein
MRSYNRIRPAWAVLLVEMLESLSFGMGGNEVSVRIAHFAPPIPI